MCIPNTLEISVIRSDRLSFPSIVLFSGPARMVRPVYNIKAGSEEIVGAFEQIFMGISLTPDQITDYHTHVELNQTNILSMTASLTPYSDYNQSPRNMYQCQMLKQTMGTPCIAHPYRFDNKMYRLYTPQTPIVKNENHDRYGMDDYLTGTNAIVAVLSYSGYTMEDAMLINKSSYERGFANGCVYKSQMIDLTEGRKSAKTSRTDYEVMSNITDTGTKMEPTLDEDGLPSVGLYLQKGDPFYVTKKADGSMKVHYYKGKEPAYVDQINVIGIGAQPEEELTKIHKVYVCII